MGIFDLTGWFLLIAPCNNFQIQLTTATTLKKKSLQISKSKAHREPSDHRNNTTPFPFTGQNTKSNFPFLGFRFGFSFPDSRFWIHISLSGFVIRISRIWRGNGFDYERLKCLRIIAQSRFWKFPELRTATLLTRVRIVQSGHPKKLTGMTMTKSVR